MSFVNLHMHSTYSILDGLSSIDEIVEKCQEYGQNSCALTDHGNISGMVSFYESCKKRDVKPIIGCEVYLSEDVSKKERNTSHFLLLAKNETGRKNLISLVSDSNREENFYYKPRMSYDMIKQKSEGLIGFSGHPGSRLFNVMFKEPPFKCKTAAEASSCLDSDYMNKLKKEVSIGKQIFGDDFYIEIQTINMDMECYSEVSVPILRRLAEETNTKCIATADPHYPNKEDYYDHSVILCMSMKKTLKEIELALEKDEEFSLKGFFSSNNFYIPKESDLIHNTKEEIENTQKIADEIEDYEIFSKPRLPDFPCPNKSEPNEYLTELCRRGWTERLVKNNVVNTKEKIETYKKELLDQLEIYKEANLAGYFLIVQDYINWGKNQGWFIGPARGSVGGSLVAYLTKITNIDPIVYGLFHSRFYNAGRNTKDYVSLPDIDSDFPTDKRDLVIEYVKNKYGDEKVCQICTFGTIGGRSAIKSVLKTQSVCGFEESDKIAKLLPEKAKVEDKMDDVGESSLIRWTLTYMPDALSDYCRLTDEGEYVGEFGQYFKQAVRLEGVIRSIGVHAAGVIIADDDIQKYCPMIRQKDGGLVAALEMSDAEKSGLVKFDFLGTTVLDRCELTNEKLRYYYDNNTGRKRQY